MRPEEIAARIAGPLPKRLAFIGDSLTALNPERNYVAIVSAALASAFGDAVSVINAGVGGDTIERVEARLDEVIAQKPDAAFLFLGHNDSKIEWDPETQDYGQCFLPIDRFEACFRRVISQLRDAGVARLILVSPAASHEPTCRAVHETKKAEGVVHNFFGRADLMEAYAAVVKRLADEVGAEFLDLYTPMKAAPGWAELADDSGVHLSEAGDRFVAAQVLKHLAGMTR